MKYLLLKLVAVATIAGSETIVPIGKVRSDPAEHYDQQGQAYIFL